MKASFRRNGFNEPSDPRFVLILFVAQAITCKGNSCASAQGKRFILVPRVKPLLGALQDPRGPGQCRSSCMFTGQICGGKGLRQ
jgi:hypothetical protein